MMTMMESPLNNPAPEPEQYLGQLLRDQETLKQFTRDIKFSHVERLLEEEISSTIIRLMPELRVKMQLPSPELNTEMQKVVQKVMVPVEKYPKFNYVGRILGPKGATAKQIEKLTGVKVMVRGKGSMRDVRTESKLKADEKYRHLQDALHVLLEVFDYPNRAEVRMEEAKRLLDQIMTPPKDDSDDPLKETQLKIHEIAQGARLANALNPMLLLGTPLVATNGGVNGSASTQSITQLSGPQTASPVAAQNAAAAAAAATGLQFGTTAAGLMPFSSNIPVSVATTGAEHIVQQSHTLALMSGPGGASAPGIFANGVVPTDATAVLMQSSTGGHVVPWPLGVDSMTRAPSATALSFVHPNLMGPPLAAAAAVHVSEPMSLS